MAFLINGHVCYQGACIVAENCGLVGCLPAIVLSLKVMYGSPRAKQQHQISVALVVHATSNKHSRQRRTNDNGNYQFPV